MKAAVVTAFKKPLEIKQVDIPKPGPSDVLIKNIACGVCHTDLHVANGDWDIKPELPRIPGHEGIGEIIELGSMVGDHLKKGDIVGVPWLHSTCLHCEYCLTGRETLCKGQSNSGYSCDGCFAEYALMDANFAVKLPEGMDPYTSAPLYCAGVTVYKALKVSQVRPGEWVSIVGVGGLGSVAVRYAVAMGMRVVTVVAPNDKTAVQLSKDCGAEEVFDGPADQHGKWIQDKVGGVHGSVITVPIVSAFEQAFQSVRRGGRVVAVALPNGKMAVPIVDCVLGGIELVGSIVGTRKDLQEALEIAKLHKIECKVQKRKLEDINEIFDDMINYRISGRIVIDYSAK
ncbi:unnamed protein product [Adineta steineri]|uniref:alcohol dehydrogenase n=1 Tax=Adineta steineri TaxID=433720 RepID=A0A818XSV9_9BILA|nr:unnamed protein product [Adineta steineri]CAF0723960.1 unnamed protein product [Adineta steineri]CAF0738680.1 unnamed protein product [Adineta steineri]CAF3721589.1 unnamed protein product [Adineta steineri]CAF3743338.1 unnamed protein product [Adineta steineri]